MPYTVDVVITEPFPAVVYDATETAGTYFEDREINGVMYHLQNATFDGTQWLSMSAAASFATTFNADGTISHYMVPAGTTSWTSWFSLGNGQRRVFNVRDFGALGNGTGDDSTAINDANSAAVSLGGGYIYLPAGTYQIAFPITLGSPTLPDVPITIGGDGSEFTTIFAKTGYNGGNSINMVTNIQSGTATDSIVQRYIYIEKLRFDANATNNPYSGQTGFLGPIYLKQVQYCGVRDCEVVNSSHNGILISGNENSNQWPAGSTDINFTILRNHINLDTEVVAPPDKTLAFPIRAEGPNCGLIEGNVIGDQCLTHTNDAIDFPGSSHVTCRNNYVTMCGDGMGSNACVDSVFANNRIVMPSGYGISTFGSGGPADGSVGVSNVTVTGNVIIYPNKAAIRISCPYNGGTIPLDFSVLNNTIELSPAGNTGILVEASQGSVTGNLIDIGRSGSNGIVIDSTPAFGTNGVGNANVTVTGNTIVNGGAASGGIEFTIDKTGTSTSSHCVVTDNNVSGVTIALAATFANMPSCVVRNNTGINPWSGVGIMTPAISTSPIVNPYPFDIWVTVSGGTHVTISINGNPTGVKDGSVLLPAGGSTIQLSYTKQPSWTWLAY